jgi:hypothetical protein
MRTATVSHLARLGPTASRALFTRWELLAGIRNAGDPPAVPGLRGMSHRGTEGTEEDPPRGEESKAE